MDIDYHKRVFVRFTTDDWKTFQDSDATHVDQADAAEGSGTCLFNVRRYSKGLSISFVGYFEVGRLQLAS